MRLALLALTVLGACSSSSYATKEDLARLEGRLQSLEQRSGTSGAAQGGAQGGPGAAAGMAGPGGAQGGGQGGAQGGPAGAGQPSGDQGGTPSGPAEGGEVSAEMQEMEKALASAMDAMNKGDMDGAKTQLAEVGTKYGDAKGAEMAKQLLAELEVIGSAAPPITSEAWAQGNGDLNAGKATLLVFFNVEHKNAETALGKIQALAQGAKPRGLNVVGVTRTSDAMSSDKVKEWLSGKGVTFPVALDKAGTTATAYKRATPISAVIIKSGKIVWTGNASRMNEEVLNKYL